VVATCRSNHATATANGLTIDSGLFGQNLKCRPRIVRSAAEAAAQNLGPFDYILVCVKALPSNPSIPEQIAPAVSESTSIVLIQNGVDIEAPFAESFYPAHAIISSVAYLPVTQTSPAVFTHREVEKLHLGTHPVDAPPAHKTAAAGFAALIQQGGATAVHHHDIGHERWSKLLVNAAWNPICAISRVPDATFLAASAGAADYVRDVMLEVASIAQAVGYKDVSTDTVDWQIGRAKARSLPGIEPSMLADALAGRPVEADAIVGNAVRIAEKTQVKVPLLRALYATLVALNRSFEKER
jgi:2-dehydropantoate 2-reductase